MSDTIQCPNCGSFAVAFSQRRGRHLCADCMREISPPKPLVVRRLFISYGHDAHVPLAERINQDLTARGHQTWFDKDRISGGRCFEDEIERAIGWLAEEKSSSALLLMLTPHAVRRPDGFCLNEVTRALAKGLKIIPLMVADAEPPLSICRIQWLDMRECIPIQEKEPAYRRCFERLLNAIERDQIDFDGAQQLLLNRLRPIEFDADLSPHVAKFVGREWLFAKVSKWLGHPKGHRVFWIAGGPGVGKTAIAARLAHMRPEILAVHFCKYGHSQKGDARRALTSLAYQLSTQLPGYQERLARLDLENLGIEDAGTLFDNLIVQPLLRISRPARRAIVLIDALDEATRGGRNELAEVIGADFRRTPDWFGLILTSRVEPAVCNPLQGLDAQILDTMSPENHADIRTYLEQEIGQIMPAGPERSAILHSILERSEGLFLYAARFCEDLQSGRFDLGSLDHVPAGLGGSFWQFLSRQFPDADVYARELAPALRAILASREPMPAALLGDLLKWQEDDLLRFARCVGTLFPTVWTDGGAVIQPCHKALADWLTDPAKAGHFYVNIDQSHRVLADHMRAVLQRDPATLPPYCVRNLLGHLIAAARWDEACEVASSIGHISRRCAARQTAELQGDLQELLSSLPEASADAQALDASQRRSGEWIDALARYASRRRPSEASDHGPTVMPEEPPPGPPRAKPIAPESQVASEAERISSDPNRLERVRAFSIFVNRELTPLEQFGHLPGFVAQHAHNVEPRGPVHDAAEEPLATSDSARLLRRWPEDAKFNPVPALSRTLRGHMDSAWAVACTPDGRRAVSAGGDGIFRHWDLESGRCLDALEGHDGAIFAAAITPDGGVALSGGRDRVARLWDLRHGRLIRELRGHSNWINCACLRPDGTTAITGGDDRTMRLWDTATGLCQRLLTSADGAVTAVAMTADGRFALSAHSEGPMSLWDIDSGSCLNVLIGHAARVTSVAMTPFGDLAVSVSEDATIRVWNLKTGACTRIISGHSDKLYAVDVTPDGRRAISGGEDKVAGIWDLETGEKLRSLTGFGGTIHGVALDSGGTRAIGAYSDGRVAVWDFANGLCPAVPPERPGGILALAITPNQKRLVSAHGGLDPRTNRIVTWNLETGQQIQAAQAHLDRIVSLSLVCDGSRAVTGSEDTTIRTWDIERLEEDMTLFGTQGQVRGVTAAPDGRWVTTIGDDATLRLWDMSRGESSWASEEQSAPFTCLCATPDGMRLVAGGRDGRLSAWGIDGSHPLWSTPAFDQAVIALTVSPDGRHAVTADDGHAIRIWDLRHRRCIRMFEGHSKTIRALAVTPDGNVILSGADDSTLRAWAWESGRCLAVFAAPAPILSIAVGRGGARVCAGTWARTPLFIDFDGFPFQPAVLTAHQRIDCQAQPTASAKARCPHCGFEASPPGPIVSVIEAHETTVPVGEAPCWCLPESVFADPALEASCTSCGGPLRFNPFFIGAPTSSTP